MSRKIRISSLDYGIDEKELRKISRAYGDVVDVYIGRDNRGRSNGWGVVTFATRYGADKAKRYMLKDKVLNKEARVDFFRSFGGSSRFRGDRGFGRRRPGIGFGRERGVYRPRRGPVPMSRNFRRRRERTVWIPYSQVAKKKAGGEVEKKEEPTEIVVLNHPKMSKEEIRKIFSKYGDIQNIYVKEYRIGTELSVAKIMFSTSSAARDAISGMNGKEIDGEVIIVKKSDYRGKN